MKHTKSTSGQQRNYEVGYKRPPRGSQFKKGQPSPNPTGRPRGSRNPNLTKVLLEPVRIKLQGQTRKVPYLEAWLQVVKEKALKGDLKASQILILLAKQLNMLKIEEPLDDEDLEFTVSIARPGWSPKCA